ncbi:autophagy-related protein 18f [Tripterygium wilfordii]|uniref:Autophagy-related protein 18f n=1 Tax=Tripterygium wilfordii TaxID=458696 RepID=A0A7J7C2N0_TRIWF|nr:autophagy-related protein 18f-like [Tripterygium wilfordii]KAF5728368.1 autophagy-related protein 18f [Tripterygium wilfordii]
MLRREIGESAIIFVWVLCTLIAWALGVMRNSSDAQKQLGGAVVPRPGRAGNGIIPKFRAISSYLRIVSSGASTVAKSAASAAASIVDKIDDANHDQVLWAGFDKLENEGDVTRQVLLLGYRSGFQVWDVEEANNVRDLVSKHDSPVSFMQMLPKPIVSRTSVDKFADSRPLLAVCADGPHSGGCNVQDGLADLCNGSIPNYHALGNGSSMPTMIRFYSLSSHSYVHVLKFRSIVYCVRCSSRVVAISQAAQIHCFDSSTLERAYTILTNPIITSCPGPGGIGYGPLAVGPRWLAYSGSPVVVSNSGRVSPQHLGPSASFSGYGSNGSLVAHYAKESSKQLATGIVTLGDIGYKKLSRYCSELLPDSRSSLQSGGPGLKGSGTVNGHYPDSDSVGMVIVRDIVSKQVIAQFRAHKSPISALCFDPSGTLLVTASVQGHNINVFRIMQGLPGISSGGDVDTSYVHLYRLQRGLTNAVIPDISFSDDSSWIMISSSRGTSHLFAINPFGGAVSFLSADAGITIKNSESGVMTKSAVRWPPNSGVQMSHQQKLCASGPPVTLSVVSRIRNGNSGWRGTVSGAAAAAAGRQGSLSGAIASSFRNCKGNIGLNVDNSSSKTKYLLLVFSPSGLMIQYRLRTPAGLDSGTLASVSNNPYEPAAESDGRLVVEAIQKWNICQKQSRREREDNIDIYGENGNSDNHKIYPEGMKKGNSIYPEASIATAKINPEEKHQLYISEAELQMHQARVPLWAKPEIYFQSMMMDGMKVDEGKALVGEIEIERIPTCVIEARSKELIPVLDYLQTPKYYQMRVPAVDSDINGNLMQPKSGPSESSRISHQNSSGSLESMTEIGAAVSELQCGVEETGWDGPGIPTETKDFVNNNDSLKTNTQLEIVNNRESLKMESQLKFVNNDINGLTENRFEDGDELD